MSFELDIGFVSNQGGRDLNEDFCGAVLPEPSFEAMGAIAALGDGVSMGGRGKEAAQTSVMSLLRDYYGVPATWDTSVALDRIIQAQNAWLRSQNKARSPSLGLSTLTALVLRGQSYVLAQVGDSRAYLVRDQQCLQISQDHVVALHDLDSQLTRALGLEDRVQVDYSAGELFPGDVFVLASDGVYAAIKAKVFAQLCLSAGQAQSAQQVAENLVTAALSARTHDNASALVVRVQSLAADNLQDDLHRALRLPALPQLKVGQLFDQWQVLEVLPESGNHRLYKVLPNKGELQVLAGDKPLFLKTLSRSAAQDRQAQAALAHEAWLARHLQQSKLAPYLAALVETPGERASRSAHYLLYEVLNGESWQALIDRQRSQSIDPELAQVLSLAKQAAKALGLLHQQGVVHRDIKPDNLWVGHDGELKILDLGAAISGADSPAARQSHVGTPSYVNPEQWGFALQGEGTLQTANADSDLYALGVTLYQMLTRGRLPFGEVIPYQLGRFYKDPVAPSRHNPKVPIWLDAIVLKAIARDYKQRFETGEEMLLALERGATRALSLPPGARLMPSDSATRWKICFVISLVLNLVLILWLLFLPRG